jgi:acyl-CoA synthetase (AMP-forming)/AMP-acid ligase II
VPVGPEPAELLVRGPHVFTGYWNRQQETEAAFVDGEWFRTGDIGRIDPGDGYVFITGRSKDVIISGGYNVYPREVEDALAEHPQVSEAAVVGVASERWGEQVTAFVVAAAGGLDTDDLARHAERRLAAYKRPKSIHVVDALPRDSVGKVRKQDLASGAMP